MLVGSDRLQLNHLFSFIVAACSLCWFGALGKALPYSTEAQQGWQGLEASKQVLDVTTSAASAQFPVGQPAVVVSAGWRHLSVSVFGWLCLVLGVFLLDSHLPVCSSEPLVNWKLRIFSYWYLHWIFLAEVTACAALEESQEGQASPGLKGKGQFSFPFFFPQLGVGWLGKGRWTLPSPFWASALLQMLSQKWALGRRRKPGRKSRGLGPPPTHQHQEPQLRLCLWVSLMPT